MDYGRLASSSSWIMGQRHREPLRERSGSREGMYIIDQRVDTYASLAVYSNCRCVLMAT